MRKQSRVLIGVQARSTSERLPNKCMADIDGIPMLQHVLNACHSSVKWLGSKNPDDINCIVALLVPTGDPLADYFAKEAVIIEGSEQNVLSRYEKAFKKFYPDFVVRITGDCPLIPPSLITKHIRSAVYNRMDYVSNVDPRHRTYIDGMDCEVISAKLMTWLFSHAEERYDQEHVTTLIRKDPPKWAEIAAIQGHIDLSDLHLSVDTEEDLKRVKEIIERGNKKLVAARKDNIKVFRH